MSEKRHNMLKRVNAHMFFGSLFGLLVLHPLSMFYHYMIEFSFSL